MSLPLILGAASTLGGLFGGSGSSSADRAAMAQAQAQQQAIMGRQLDGYDAYRNAIYDANRQGLFNPDSQIQQNHDDSSRAQGMELKNLAAASAVAGYKGGDTPLQNQLDASIERNRYQVASQDAQIRQNTLNNMLSSWAGLNAGGSSLNGALQTSTQNYNAAQQNYNQQQAAQGSSLGSLVGAATPYLGNLFGKSTTAAPKVATAPVSMNYGSPTNSYGLGNYTTTLSTLPTLNSKIGTGFRSFNR